MRVALTGLAGIHPLVSVLLCPNFWKIFHNKLEWFRQKLRGHVLTFHCWHANLANWKLSVNHKPDVFVKIMRHFLLLFHHYKRFLRASIFFSGRNNSRDLRLASGRPELARFAHDVSPWQPRDEKFDFIGLHPRQTETIHAGNGNVSVLRNTYGQCERRLSSRKAEPVILEIPYNLL